METVETWRIMCFNVQRKKEYLCQHCGVCVCKSKRLSDSVNYGILLLLLFLIILLLHSWVVSLDKVYEAN